ncbi:permease of the major facilitator superfamily [Clostridium sp. SY8519]|uniref:DHA2 family efflux MFS transporter permease subunit n=1 Tax=Clostridium sp. (strain SY8519) TaxID=1042156 RepID=UPI0002171C52|nr:DHA2 family efflux MFS transporter permease subunit [Clostridium sp. SY8519]BAK47073.1 permease of the major facilitator superfamily [Clostridium sp. SY8519]
MNQSICEQKSFSRVMDLKLILSVIAAGLLSFTGVVVETSMNVAFPTLMREFGIGTAATQWITTGYLLVISIVIPASAFLKKRFRMRQLFLTAVLLFLFGTVMGAAASSFAILLLARLIQGLGTGIALPLMYNIVLEQAPVEKMGFMMGIATMITAVAPAVGPPFGGWVVHAAGWRYIFLFLIPVLVLALVLGLTSIRQASAPEPARLDKGGFVLLSLCFVCLLLGINQAGIHGWISVQSLGLLGAAAAAFVIFAVLGHHREQPLLNLRVFRNRCYSASAAGIFLMFFLALGLGYLMPNYAQLVLGSNSLQAGVILVPGAVLGAVLTPFSGRIYDRIGAAGPILTGSAAAVIGLLLYTASGSLSVTKMQVFYLFFAFGQAMAVGNTMTHGLEALPRELQADGNAVYNALQQVSAAVGTSIITTIVSAAQLRLPHDLVRGTQNGAHTGFQVLLAATVLFVIVSLISMGRKEKEAGVQ